MSKKSTQTVFDPVDLQDGRRLILVANTREVPIKSRRKAHLIDFGWSVKNPTDTGVKDDLGLSIAKGRAEKHPVFQIATIGERVSKTLLNNLAKVITDEFNHRFGNYVPLSGDKKKPKQQRIPAADGIATGEPRPIEPEPTV